MLVIAKTRQCKFTVYCLLFVSFLLIVLILSNTDDRFFEWISKQVKDLISSSPVIPDDVVARYRELTFGTNIADPFGIDDILINRTDHRKGSDEVELDQIQVDTEPRSGLLTRRDDDVIEPTASEGTVESSLDLYYQSKADAIAIDRWNNN